MGNNKGVIENDKNPFSCDPWIAQGGEFNDVRRKLLPALFGKDERAIRTKFSVFDGTSLAFIAIRWGYARWVDGKIEATEKWMNEQQK